MENDDTPKGGDSLSIDQAAAAFVKATTKEADPGQSEVETETASDDTTDEELPEGDESASEEDDGAAEDEGQADETEDDEEPDTERGRYVAHNGRVKLPDGSESTVADLIQGNLRDRDYRQKTMESAEVKKTFETRSAALEASQQRADQMIEYNISLVKSVIPPEPDPTKANPASPNYDPAGYQAEEVAYRQWAQHLSYLESQQTQAQQERAKKATETEKETADREWGTLVEKLPHLKDTKRVDPFVADLKKYATETYGFKPEEMKAIALDHRLALALNDAIKWNKLQASKANVQKKVEGRPPVQKGGKRLNPSESRARAGTDAMNRLKQSGSVEDAAAAYIATRKTG
jgi:hypothetical protein